MIRLKWKMEIPLLIVSLFFTQDFRENDLQQGNDTHLNRNKLSFWRGLGYPFKKKKILGWVKQDGEH